MADLNQTNPEDSGQSNIESSEQVGQAPAENFVGEEDVQVKFCVKRCSLFKCDSRSKFVSFYFCHKISVKKFSFLKFFS